MPSDSANESPTHGVTEGVTQGTTRRGFIAGAGAATLSLKYAGPAIAQAAAEADYGQWEDLMRSKWTWDKVVHGTHGTNCQGG